MDQPLTDKERAFADTALEVADRIWPLLKDHPSDIQGAVMGHLMAGWLNEHYAEDVDQQGEVWASLLTAHAKYILRLARLQRQRRRAG